MSQRCQQSHIIGRIKQNLGNIGDVIAAEILDVKVKAPKIAGDLSEIRICGRNGRDRDVINVNILTVSTRSTGENKTARGWRPCWKIGADDGAALPNDGEFIADGQFDGEMLPAKIGVGIAV